MLNSKGEEINDININVNQKSANRLSDADALKKQAGAVHRTFESKTAFEESAQKLADSYTTALEKEMNEDKENGFDINDIESIKNFKIDYTPLGNSVLVKQIVEQQGVGKLIIFDSSNKSKKVVVMVAGLMVGGLVKRGDILSLRALQTGQGIPYTKIKLNKVEFWDINFGEFSGIFQPEEEMLKRQVEQDNKFRANNDR